MIGGLDLPLSLNAEAVVNLPIRCCAMGTAQALVNLAVLK